MEFTPNILRLDACLCAAGTQLQSTELVAADALLAVQTAPGHLHALKHAAHHLRQLLREHNHLIKQSLAFEALARYLGHPDWNTAHKLLLAREGNQKPTALGGSAWLYVFEIFDKSSGVVDIVSGLNLVGKRLRDVARLRLISCPDSPHEGAHVLNQWRSPGSASLSIADALNDSRRRWLGSAISQGLPAFGLVQGLCMLRHFIYVELKEPVAGMRRSYRTISGELERVFRCHLSMPALDSLGAFGNMQVLPEGFLQWTHNASAVADNSWLTTQAVPCATVFDFEWASATPRLVRYGVGLPGASVTSETNANLQRWVQTLTAKGVTLAQGGLASMTHPDFAPLLAGSWLAEGKLANPSTGVPVASHSGDLTFLDFWATCESNGRPPFFLVSAMSGAGKSFLANELIVAALSNHRNVRVVDRGQSYAKLTDVFSGENIFLARKTAMSLNPFSGLDRVEHVQRLLPLWAVTLCELTSVTVPDMSRLTARLAAAWQQHREALDAGLIVEALLSTDDIGLVLLGAALQRLHFEQPGWFDGPSLMAQSRNGLVVFDWNELEQDGATEAMVIVLLMANLAQEALLNPQPGLYLLDEAWSTCGTMSQAFSRCVLDCFALHSHAVGTTVQSLEEVRALPFAEELLNRSAWLLMMQQRRGSIEQYARLKSPYSSLFNAADVREALFSVKTGRGYSSLAVLTPEKYHGTYRFAVDEFSHLAYSMSPQEWLEYKALRDGMTPGEAIAQQMAFRRSAAIRT